MTGETERFRPDQLLRAIHRAADIQRAGGAR
jgi:hypothetical protein